MANELCGGFCFLSFGMLLLIGFAQRFLLYQKIMNTPTSKVRSAAVGLIELFGKAVCMEPMESPISKARCVYWRIHCEYYKSGKHGGWRTIYDSKSSSRFFLEDETGRMPVDPKDAEVDIPQDFQTIGHMDQGGIFGILKSKLLDKRVLDWLTKDSSARSAFDSHRGAELRVTEYFIAENDPIYALGNAEMESNASGEGLVLKKGKFEQIMYISDSGERKVADNLKWGMLVPLLIGLGLCAAGAYFLLANL